MITLLSPFWLAALAALLVPIVLHLISRGRTRRQRVPSIRLMIANDSRKARRLRPTQLLLLALRCALLAALALALAAPRWPVVSSGDHPDWVLVAPSLLTQRETFQQEVPGVYADLDRLVASGAELRVFAPGFARVNEAGLVGPAPDPADPWSLLREADLEAPYGSALNVFVADRLEALRGTRPTLARNVSWISVALSGRNRWIERGGGDGPLDVIVGDSSPEGTMFFRASLDQSASGGATGRRDPVAWDDDDVLRMVPGAAADSLEGDDAAIVRPISAFRAGVYHEADRAEDAAYVRAALAVAADRALITLSELDGDVSEALKENDGSRSQPLDLVFWLASDAVPRSLLTSVCPSGVVVSDGGDRHESCGGSVTTDSLTSTGRPGRHLSLRRCSPPPDGGDATALWTDGAGRTLLSVAIDGAPTHYRFHGRFHPAWSDLPTDPAFPKWMLDLVEQAGADAQRIASSAGERSDLRSAGGQGPPQVRKPGLPATTPSPLPQQLLWLLVAALVVTERALAAGAREARHER